MRKRKVLFSNRTLKIIIAVLAAVLLVSLIAVGCTEGEQPDTSVGPTDKAGKLEMVLLGDQTLVLEYGTEYTDPGCEVFYDGQKVDASITYDQPQMNTLGTYEVHYTAVYEGREVHVKRIVELVDTQPPEITLTVDPSHCTEIGGEYEEEGYLATDNYDGDITDKVTTRQEGDVIYYTVADSSGNEVTVQRTIVYGDSMAPVITLSGESTVTIMAGQSFTEPGYTASDNVDGDLTGSVNVSGSYDKYLPGTYTFTYTVTDAHGNTATAQRTVVVKGRTQPEVVNPDGKVIYLTFDDGPSEHTPRLLQVLAKYNVKATFFVVGSARLEYLDDIVDGGHAIGVHTNTHHYDEVYASEDAFFADFWAIWNKIKDRTGVETTLTRFPGGSSNRVSMQYCEGIMTRLTKAIEAQGFQYFDWNVDSHDASNANSTEEVYQNVISGIQGKSYSIVLQHDIKGYSVDAVEKIIQWGLANGYTFKALDPTSPKAHHPVNN